MGVTSCYDMLQKKIINFYEICDIIGFSYYNKINKI